jgi:hypothetical protein
MMLPVILLRAKANPVVPLNSTLFVWGAESSGLLRGWNHREWLERLTCLRAEADLLQR